MSYKMKGSPMYRNFGVGNSPIKYDFKKSADYSPDATKGKLGDKIAKAVTPANLAEILPIGKIGKAAKAAYKYFTE